MSAKAQVVRANDGFAQFKLGHEGLAGDSVCKRTVDSDALTKLPGYSTRHSWNMVEGLASVRGHRTSLANSSQTCM